jgi:serine/threonine-protein kinase RsbW
MKCPADFGIDDSAMTVVTVPNIVERVRAAEEVLLRHVEQFNIPEDALFGIKLALEEALVNAIRHGNSNDPTKQITLKYYVDAAKLIVAIRDEGGGFKPAELPDPTLDENLEKPHGRGVMLMRAYMTEVRYNQRGNEVWLYKEIIR